MRRLITICAVVGFMLAISGTAQALLIVTEYTSGNGETHWVNTTSAEGDWSLELYTPGENIMYRAGVEITGFGDTKVKDFDGWDYWAKGPMAYGPQFRMYLDTPEYENRTGEDYDMILQMKPYHDFDGYGEPTWGVWVNWQSSTPYPYGLFAWDGATFKGGHDISMWPNGTTWSEFQDLDANIWGDDHDFGEATVVKVRIFSGDVTFTDPLSTYLDDFTLDGINFFTLEEGFTVVPEPATLLLFGLGGLGLIRSKRSV